MDEQATVVPARRRRNRAEAAQLVAEFEASGLSRTEFCQSHRLSLATLGRYLQHLRQAGGGPDGAARWLAVELAGTGSGCGGGAGSGLAIALGSGRRIEIRRGFDPQTLLDLLGVLERH
jgi:hypothetical protein